MKRPLEEYNKFEAVTRALLGVPHAEIKEQMDAEKKAKKRKRKGANHYTSTKNAH